MCLMKAIRLEWLFLFLTIAAGAQDVPPPGSIRLLPGYHHRLERGIDSKLGTIWKQGGLQLHYDIGEMAGTYTECGWRLDEGHGVAEETSRQWTPGRMCPYQQAEAYCFIP